MVIGMIGITTDLYYEPAVIGTTCITVSLYYEPAVMPPPLSLILSHVLSLPLPSPSPMLHRSLPLPLSYPLPFLLPLTVGWAVVREAGAGASNVAAREAGSAPGAAAARAEPWWLHCDFFFFFE